jgi:hypothetical protein
MGFCPKSGDERDGFPGPEGCNISGDAWAGSVPFPGLFCVKYEGESVFVVLLTDCIVLFAR